MHSFVKNLDQWSFRNSWLELLLLLTKTEKEVRCGILIHSFVFLELKAMNNFCTRPKIGLYRYVTRTNVSFFDPSPNYQRTEHSYA